MLHYLPAELLQYVYSYSGNAFLIYVCRSIFYALNNHHSRFIFCCHLLKQRASTRKANAVLAKSVNHCLAQQWFDYDLIRKIQESSSSESETDLIVRPKFAPDVYLPARCLKGPWTDDKVALLEALRSWNLQPLKGKVWHPGLSKALIEKDRSAIKQFLLAEDAIQNVVRTQDIVKIAELNCQVYLLKTAIGLYFRDLKEEAFDQAWLELCSAIMNELGDRIQTIRAQAPPPQRTTANDALDHMAGYQVSACDRTWDRLHAAFEEVDGIKARKTLVRSATSRIGYSPTYLTSENCRLSQDAISAGWHDITGYWGVLAILGYFKRTKTYVWCMR